MDMEAQASCTYDLCAGTYAFLFAGRPCLVGERWEGA